jgi:DNA replication protein DnaC
MTMKIDAAPPDPLEVLRQILIELSLTTLARELSSLLAHAEQSSPAYSSFLRLALEVEREARVGRKVQRRLRWSRLGPQASLDGFDFSARPQLSPQVVRELLNCRFVEEKRNVILVGRPSTGKTTVARAIGHSACQLGYSVYYVSMEEMLQTLHASRADRTYRKVFRRIEQPDLLILEDAGFSSIDRDGANELFRVVGARHRQRSTMVVTNV